MSSWIIRQVGAINGSLSSNAKDEHLCGLDVYNTAAAMADNPQKRLIEPREIGALAAFLCKQDALGITGQDLTVSGGSIW
jgi:NAD(P)-dependent dehydrogenase (short-subunit alcohol dehydrogenase family)